VLENGDEIRAGVVVSTLHPRTAFLEHIGAENLPPDFASDIEHWKTRSGVVKINLALGELPDFIADPGTNCRSTTPARSRWRRRWSTSSARSRTPARAGPRCGRSATA
jgi:hypothetical protein